VTPAAGPENSDAAVGIDLLADTATEDERFEVLADSAYDTGDALADSQHSPIIKPWPLDWPSRGVHPRRLHPHRAHRRPGRVGDLPERDHPPDHPDPEGDLRRGLPQLPFLSRCTTSARGKKLSLHPHQALQRAHRVRAQGPDFQAVYREHRPMVERSIAWLVAGGNRRLRFHGTQLNDLWLHHRVAGAQPAPTAQPGSHPHRGRLGGGLNSTRSGP
jgi:hypothetical protein